MSYTAIWRISGNIYTLEKFTNENGDVVHPGASLNYIPLPTNVNEKIEVVIPPRGISISQDYFAISINNPNDFVIPDWIINTNSKIKIYCDFTLELGIYDGKNSLEVSYLLSLNNAVLINSNILTETSSQNITNLEYLPMKDNFYYNNASSIRTVNFNLDLSNNNIKISGQRMIGYIRNGNVYLEDNDIKPVLNFQLINCNIYFRRKDYNGPDSTTKIDNCTFKKRTELTEMMTSNFSNTITFEEGFYANANEFDFSELFGSNNFTFNIKGPVGSF